jgi:hypothetical protein
MISINSERQKKYIIKMKNNNLDVFLEYNRLKSKRHYYKNKNYNNENKEIIIPILDPVDDRINPINRSILKTDTINNYIKIFKMVYKNYYNKEFDDDSDLIKVLNNQKYDVKKLNNQLNFIRKDTINVIKNNYKYINVIYSIITRLRYFDKAVKIIYPYIEYKQFNYNEKRINKKPDENTLEQMNAVSFDKDHILFKLSNSDLTDYEKLIYALFMLIPTRRPSDYRRMLISHIEPIDDNDGFNYYYNCKLYIFNTKNKNKIVLNIPDELDAIINKDHQYLLGKDYTQSNLSKEIMRVFYMVYGISISAVQLRRLYCTYINKQNLTYLERKELSNQLGHSIEENMKYAYFD